MLKTRDDIFREVLVRNSRSTTEAFITDTMLKDWFFDSHIWAAAYHKWPFTEGRVQTTFATGGGPASDEWYFEGYKADSFRLMTIGGKRLRKLNYEDYLILREEEPTRNDRVYSDAGRYIFINPAIDISGTLTAWGQYQPYVDVTDENGVTIFTGYDEEGNEAIVEKMSAYLKRREHLTQEAELHDQRAMTKLEEVFGRVRDEQYAYQTHPDRGGMYKYINVVDGRGANNNPFWSENQF